MDGSIPGEWPSIQISILILKPSHQKLVNYGWEDNPTIITNTPDAITVAPQNAGTANYFFQVEDEFGCQFDTAVNISVLPPTHPDCYNCTDLIEPMPDTAFCQGDSLVLNESTNSIITDSITFEAHPNYAFAKRNHPPTQPYESILSISHINQQTLEDVTIDLVSVCHRHRDIRLGFRFEYFLDGTFWRNDFIVRVQWWRKSKL